MDRGRFITVVRILSSSFYHQNFNTKEFGKKFQFSILLERLYNIVKKLKKKKTSIKKIRQTKQIIDNFRLIKRATHFGGEKYSTV